MPKDSKKSDQKGLSDRPYDMYRDSLVRVLGYAGFIGGAVRPFVPYSVVSTSRAVATTYICQDIIDKAAKASNDKKRFAVAVGDATLWQLLASVILPSMVLAGVNNMRCSLMCGHSYKTKRIAHTAISLITIALIMKPIDAIVDVVMKETYQKCTAEEKKSQKKEKEKTPQKK